MATESNNDTNLYCDGFAILERGLELELFNGLKSIPVEVRAIRFLDTYILWFTAGIQQQRNFDHAGPTTHPQVSWKLWIDTLDQFRC